MIYNVTKHFKEKEKRKQAIRKLVIDDYIYFQYAHAEFDLECEGCRKSSRDNT